MIGRFIEGPGVDGRRRLHALRHPVLLRRRAVPGVRAARRVHRPHLPGSAQPADLPAAQRRARRPHRRKVIMQKRVAPALLALFAVAYLAPLGIRPLYETDEFRYAEIPREMLASGDWVVPRLDGMRYFEKPALGYWLTASSMALFGQNPFAVRLPVALSAGVTALALFLLVRRFSFAKGAERQRPRSRCGGGRGGHPADERHVLRARLLQHAGYAADDVPDRGGGPFLFRVRDGEPAAQGAVPAVLRRRRRVRVPDEGISRLRRFCARRACRSCSGSGGPESSCGWPGCRC